jgi:hypothetical protein
MLRAQNLFEIVTSALRVVCEKSGTVNSRLHIKQCYNELVHNEIKFPCQLLVRTPEPNQLT